MTGFSVIAIIATIILVGMAGIGIQITIFLYLIRRIDSLQKELSEARQEFLREISKVVERVARLEGIITGRQEMNNGRFTGTGDD